MHRFKPVTIRDPATGMKTGVSDVEAALAYMRKWPVRAKLKAAYPICYGAIADPPTSAVEEAQEAFVEAAKEAKVLREG